MWQYNRNSGLTQGHTTGASVTQREYPFHFRIDPEGQNLEEPIEVKLFDAPTTLSTIVASVKLFLPNGKLESEGEQEYLEERARKNFSRILKILANKNTLTGNHVVIGDGATI